MFHLTREVRFALTGSRDPQFQSAPTNSFAAYPSLTGVQQYLALQVTLAGELQTDRSYLCNIKEIDQVVRERAIGKIPLLVGAPHAIPAQLMEILRDGWPGAQLVKLRLFFSPFLSVECRAKEHPMVRLNQTFEFCASHRLHSPALSDEENRRTYGKCNNPHGHGHNYQVQVTLAGTPDKSGLLVDIPAFEQIVKKRVIDRFDHKHLNVEAEEFATLIPSVENIAKVIYGILKPAFAQADARLASVTVWETQKTWCEYTED